MNNQRKEIENFIKEKHCSYYKKMGWEHRDSCICHKWDTTQDELKEIEELAEKSEDIKPEELPF